MSEPVQSSDPQPSAEAARLDAVRKWLYRNGLAFNGVELERGLNAFVAEREREALERAAKEADAEPELPGTMPDLARLAFEIDPEEYSRNVVRVTKRNIASRIRALVGSVDRASRREGAK